MIIKEQKIGINEKLIITKETNIIGGPVYTLKYWKGHTVKISADKKYINDKMTQIFNLYTTLNEPKPYGKITTIKTHEFKKLKVKIFLMKKENKEGDLYFLLIENRWQGEGERLTPQITAKHYSYKITNNYYLNFFNTLYFIEDNQKEGQND